MRTLLSIGNIVLIVWSFGVLVALDINRRKSNKLHEIWQSAIKNEDWEMSDMCLGFAHANIRRMNRETIGWPYHLLRRSLRYLKVWDYKE